MTTRTASERTRAARQGAGDEGHRNEVVLVGRVGAVGEERELPSGDRLLTFRLAVDRGPGGAGGTGGRQRVDALECTAWSARVRRSVARWDPGDLVEVTGALRRRFFQTPAGAASRVEVEVSAARLVRRGTSA